MGFNPQQNLQFFVAFLNKGLSLRFMCSDQHLKYWMPRGFPLTSSSLMDYHVEQYTHVPLLHPRSCLLLSCI